MCGRYALHGNPEVVALQFGLGAAPPFKPRYNIPPSSDILAVGRRRDGQRAAGECRWGLIPAWAKDAAIGGKLANARAETVAVKPAFRQAFRAGRCLVPASGYYEWKTVEGKKHPWYVVPKDTPGAPLFALAGIAARWASPDGPLRTVALITTAANELAREIHERMPVLVQPGDYAAWLDPENDAAAALLLPYPAALMDAWPVSRRVNSPQADEPSLVERLDSPA